MSPLPRRFTIRHDSDTAGTAQGTGTGVLFSDGVTLVRWDDRPDDTPVPWNSFDGMMSTYGIVGTLSVDWHDE